MAKNTCFEVVATVCNYAFGSRVINDPDYKKCTKGKDSETYSVVPKDTTQVALLNLLFKIRELLNSKDESGNDNIYTSKFPKTVGYEVDCQDMTAAGIINGMHYTDDGMVYDVDEDQAVISVIPYKQTEKIKLSQGFRMIGAYSKRSRSHGYVYNYTNELDHVLTYCICRMLLGKDGTSQYKGFLPNEHGMSLLYWEAWMKRNSNPDSAR